MKPFYAQQRLLLTLLLTMLAIGAKAQTGTALAFDGVDDYLTVYVPPKPDYTIEARIMFTGTTTASQSIVVYTAGDPTTTYSNQIRTDASGHFVNYTYDGALKVVTGTTVAAPNTWYHITITGKTGDSLRLFVNGVQEGSLAAGNIWQGGGVYLVGSQSGGGYGYFKGTMDEVRIWTCALSAPDIANGVGCSTGGAQPSLLRLYKLNQGTAGGSNTGVTTVADSSGNGSTAYHSGFALSGSTSNWIAPTGALSTTCTPVAMPEIDVRGGGLSIADGRNYSLAPDSTEFGYTTVGTTRRFKIHNIGNTALSIGTLSFSDTSFIVSAQPAASVAVGDSTSFTVKYVATVAGYHHATLHIANSDCDEGDFDFYFDGITAPAGALDFDGTNDYLSFAANPLAGGAAMTFEGWVYWRGGSYGQRIFDFGSSAGHSVYLTTNNAVNGSLRFVMANGTEQVLDGPTLSTYTWHHIAVTATEGGTWTMYVDGSQVAKASGYTNAIPAAVANNYLGKSQSASDPTFNGQMDEVRFWNRALCIAEITNNKNCELYYPYIQNSLSAYLSFGQNAAGGINNGDTLAYDGSRAANTATLHNFTLSGSGSNWVTGYLSNGSTCGYYAPSGLNDSTESVTQYVSSTTYFNACGEIAQVAPYSGNPVAGNVTVKVTRYDTVPSNSGHAYVQRWYDIQPAVNAATATAYVMLYFTQQEFDNYNAGNGSDPDLPTSASDATGISHIRVKQYRGTGTAPGAYSGSTVIITPTNTTYSGGRWAVTFPVTGAGGLTLSGLSASALPVKLISFNAEVGASGGVKLSWNVASQTGVASYVVERSHDGRDFSDVVTLAASDSYQYEATDAAPYAGKNYYRLRLVDGDGGTSFSAVQTVLFQQRGQSISLNPVPATTVVTLHLSDESLLNTTATITDLQGRCVKTITLRACEQTISLDDMQPGVYLLSCAADAQKQSVKLIKL